MISGPGFITLLLLAASPTTAETTPAAEYAATVTPPAAPEDDLVPLGAATRALLESTHDSPRQASGVEAAPVVEVDGAVGANEGRVLHAAPGAAAVQPGAQTVPGAPEQHESGPSASVSAAAKSPYPADPAATQLMLSPTAYTLGEGQSRVGVTELALFQYNHGLSDNLQLGINTLFVFFTAIDLKLKFVDTGDFAAAALVGAGFSAFDRDIFGLYTRVVGTQRFDRIAVTAGLGIAGGSTGSSDDQTWGGATLGADWRVGRHIGLLAEYNLNVDFNGRGDRPVHSLTWGGRLIWSRIAVTIGYLSPLMSETLQEGVVGFPYIDFSHGF